MSQTEQRVAEAEAQLQAARQDLAKEQREADKDALRAAVASGREYKEQSAALAQQLAQANAELAQVRGRLEQANEQLAEHDQAQPKILDFPTEAEVEAWDRKRSRLLEKRAAIIKQAQAADFLRAQTLLATIAAARQVEQQQYVVANLQNKLEDPEHFARGWVGGINGI